MRRRGVSAGSSDSNPTNAIVVNGAEFDTNSWVFACKNGVNLKTGKIRPGKPADLITKASPVEYYNCETPAPIWERFLQETHKGDDTLHWRLISVDCLDTK